MRTCVTPRKSLWCDSARKGQIVDIRRSPRPERHVRQGPLVPRWMISSSHVMRTMVQGVERVVPYGESYHARAMGSIVTACGLNAQFWKNFYDRSFVAGELGACADCAAKVQSELAMSELRR